MENAAEVSVGESATDSPYPTRNVSPETDLSVIDHSIFLGLNNLQAVCGETARNSGWHADRPVQGQMLGQSGDFSDVSEDDEAYAVRLRNWQGMKIMLMVSELAEGVEELRKGYTADYTYYSSKNGGHHDEQMYTKGVPQLKPEGVPSELADTIIRTLDFCYTEGIPMAGMILEKLAFNRTRGHKHGGKAV